MSKMIGFKVPEYSDLSERLKEVAHRRRMPYAALLRKWIEAEERDLEIEPPSRPESEGMLANVEARFAALDGEIEEIKIQLAGVMGKQSKPRRGIKLG